MDKIKINVDQYEPSLPDAPSIIGPFIETVDTIELSPEEFYDTYVEDHDEGYPLGDLMDEWVSKKFGKEVKWRTGDGDPYSLAFRYDIDDKEYCFVLNLPPESQGIYDEMLNTYFEENEI